MFGDARPREEILQRRGLDPTAVDQQYERKAAPIRYTVVQEERLEVARAELEAASVALREANENEMPEEEFRLAEDVKRKELNALMEEFAKTNLKDVSETTKSGTSSTTYGSLRRQSAETRDVNRGRNNHESDKYHHDPPHSSGRFVKEEKKEVDQAFASFNTRRRHSTNTIIEGEQA